MQWWEKTNLDHITIHDATEHNLNSVHADIPRYNLTVVTGVSGSGKSSLVFDTLYREAERRYLESFSTYARQFLGKLTRPSVGYITGLSPAISVDQKRVVRNPRSTVGTLTELYDYLRLLLARLGTLHPSDTTQHTLNEDFKIERRLFSFNSPVGACPACKGLGVQDRIDINLLIADPSKTLREGALVITTPTGYIIYSQVTMDVLNKVCEAHGFNVDIPWRDLTEDQKHIVLNGSEKIKIPYGKHPLESRLKWSGITAKPREEGFYKGILPVMENILRVDRNKNILRFARSMPCDTCHGTRLKPEALAVHFKGRNIAQLAALTIHQLEDYFQNLTLSPEQTPIVRPLKNAILQRTDLMKKLGLGYLTLDRESTTLSGGEAQRIRLATQMGTGLRGILYTLDEPSIGLHHRDNRQLLELLQKLKSDGNTVVMVAHDQEAMQHADRIIDIGPGAGVQGGEILFNGTYSQMIEPNAIDQHPQLAASRTRAFLTGKEFIPTPSQRRQGNGHILLVKGAAQHNLKQIDVPFRLGALNVVTGVSGAGKSTLVHNILANYLKQQLHDANSSPGLHETIEGIDFIDKVIEIDQAPIGRTPRSNPATYTKVFDHIRDLYATLPESKQKKWTKGRFSFNVKGGRCETCEGAGITQIGMHFLGNVDVLCHECNGKRFNDETLEIRYRGKSIHDVLEMPIAEALVFFKDHAKISGILQAMSDLGLGYIALGQSATTLSGGEAQRIKLAAQLSRPATGKTLYILDEPTTGLHTADIQILLKSLNRLVQKGNTVITVEHHPDFIKTADWIIDIGPDSGSDGGELVAIGIPETVSQEQRSHTGLYLKEILSGKRQKTDLQPVAPPAEEPVVPEPPIQFKGISTHNLKHIDVEIPVNRITVITGVSGSGKSSLAFDTIFAEGQQRFLSRFSTYARTMMADNAGVDREIETCSGLMPTIAVSQKTATANPRSTVGTMTEILDFYRLLFARAGTPHCPQCRTQLEKGNCPACGYKGQATLLSSMFSFNHHQGACTHCKGMGLETVCDPQKLVTHPEKSILDGAMSGTKTGRFYGDPYGQYIAILTTVGQQKGIDYRLPWQQLDETARQIAMYGTGETIYQVTWKYKRKNREGEHSFQTPWPGFVHHINQEYERKHADRRGEAMLSIMKDRPCPQCNGQRLKPQYLAVTIDNLNIADLTNKTITQSIQFFTQLTSKKFLGVQNPFFKKGSGRRRHIIQDILQRLKYMQDVGLNYLTLDRRASTLSGGEAQRIRLAGQLGAGLTGVLYILDEPTIGLHSRDTQRLLSVLKKLRDQGNTIILVEHDAEIIQAADHIIDLGPVGGRGGGYITGTGTVEDIRNNPQSLTGKYLNNPDALAVPPKCRNLKPGLQIKAANANNLKRIHLEIPSEGIAAITGVSGSGKSSLLFDVIEASHRDGVARGCESINGFQHFDQVVAIDQSAIGTSPASTPATYTGIFDEIRELFARTPLAKERKYKKNRFSFNVKGGRCETCQGMGKVRTSMDFLSDVWTLCQDCGGHRYNNETLECTLSGKTISDLLNMTVSDALVFFSNQENRGKVVEVLRIMEEVGIGYLQLGQAANTLSGGEAQRLKLVAQLISARANKQNLYLLDEPTTGLHFQDVGRLLSLFHKLADAGHTLLVIEHHPDVIRHADWVLELGPEGGDRGGEIVNTISPSFSKISNMVK